MENKEILEKAIQKAIDGGWKPLGIEPFKFAYLIEGASAEDPAFTIGNNSKYSANCSFGSFEEIIYDKDFAKALWGNKLSDKLEENQDLWSSNGATNSCACFNGKAWQWHLQQMVISPDPIKYLGDNI